MGLRCCHMPGCAASSVVCLGPLNNLELLSSSARQCYDPPAELTHASGGSKTSFPTIDSPDMSLWHFASRGQSVQGQMAH
jgi:hypothetical protein